MAKLVKCPLVISKEKNPEDQKGSTKDPFQKRLNHIRIHILNNKKQTKLTHAEPTLVFEQFLYLGGLKSLHNQVKSIQENFILLFSLV